jgi:hypothetical protein
MGRYLMPRYLTAFQLSTLNDNQIHSLAGDIALAAKTSSLVQASPAMQTCVAAIATTDAALATANQTVADDHAKLRIDLASEAVDRSAVLGELRTYTTLVGNGARSPADVHGAGFPPPPPRPPRNTPPTVPVLIDNKPPRTGHGRTTVSVGDLDAEKRQFIAQQSVDGGATWTQLGVGHGKTRVVTGPSGAKVMVRFAMVRSGLVSDWSVALTVTIP